MLAHAERRLVRDHEASPEREQPSRDRDDVFNRLGIGNALGKVCPDVRDRPRDPVGSSEHA
jgi:hypothetical protein